MSSDVKTIILKNDLCPGDVLTMTAAVYSLATKHPGRFRVAVDTTANQLWENNPHVISLDEAKLNGQVQEIIMHYPLINECNQRAVHMMQGYCDYLEEILGVRVPLLTNRPHVYLTPQERSWVNQVEEITKRPTRYWLVNAGTKTDYTAKYWGFENYQRLVDMLRGHILFVQVGSSEHKHPPLRNVVNLVGKTDQRQLLRLCWHADGGVGPTSFLMHLMAAVEKPYVAIMGGREPVCWNSYPRQQLLHTVGALACCRDNACWRSRVVKLDDGSEQDNSVCLDPVFGEETIPRCMAMIRPKEVAEKIVLCNKKQP